MPTRQSFQSQARKPLPGSEKSPISDLPAALAAHMTPPRREKISITVVLHPKSPIDPTRRLTREEFASEYAPDAAAVELVQSFAEEFGLHMEPHPTAGPRSFSVSGSEAALAEAFGVTLALHEMNGHALRVRSGSINLPEQLIPHVAAVLGLDNRPQAQPHFRIAVPHATNVSYTPVQVATLYGVPAGASAKGQTIGVIELGGGFEPSDITTYFQSLSLPVPTVTPVLVDGGTNSPTTPSSADGEVLLDIEVSAAIAQGANVAVYFTPNTDQGFIDAISTAVHDTTNKPSVVSISWGGPESTWTTQSADALNTACQAAAALGVTITVAAGDDGSSDGVNDGANHVDFPGSSPNVLCCGGTKLVGSGSTITSEVVWNESANNEGATGGGVSDLFALPTWQQGLDVPAPTTSTGGRGVPDVTGNADPTTGYSVLVDGASEVIGGTSAVAPLWAGIIALANAQNVAASKPTVGFANPALYAAPTAFHDITSGNNGAFSAGPGWDACSGLGSPIAPSILTALTGTASTTPPPTTTAPPPTTPPPPPTRHKHHHETEDEADGS
jgi:kumamolisin